jgi:mono/diheme cytochrome c family protein
MKLFLYCVGISISLLPLKALARPDWSEGARPGANPYQLDSAAYEDSIQRGLVHTQIYPVEVTGMLPPLEPMRRMLEADDGNPIKSIFRKIFHGISGFREINDILSWIGLHPYPDAGRNGPYALPYPNNQKPEFLLGFGAIANPLGTGFSISCAACHSGNLFGKTVWGMTNRFPRANEVFGYAQHAFPLMTPWMFQQNTGATDGETKLFARTRDNLRRIGTKRPEILGLDTSLAQVSLSLARRTKDDYATPSGWLESFPRFEPLAEEVADSKPAVWWNLKYKNRWLSDGSVVSGNPIFTNILWNEIGRGADLKELEQWLAENKNVVEELTSAVFSSEAPRFTDFFSASEFPLAQAQHGEQLFAAKCARCHGVYEKGWSAPDAATKSAAELLATLKVNYREKTPVIDVGTDPGRWKGMKSLEQLNDLAISRNNGILIKAQKGYVPPPLVGIWARWPYFHNNSVPSLCALLTRAEDRPKVFLTGEAIDREKDFDPLCNGYPIGAAAPAAWARSREHRFDTRRAGLGNGGHDEGIFLENGKELFSDQDKRDLVRFLQTL